LEILKDEFKILTGRTFSWNKMARKLSVFSSLMSNYSFNNSFCQKIIIYLESLYNTLYFDIKFISKYWKMNSKSWQDGLFRGTKWRENYQCSRLWCQIILLIIQSRKLGIWIHRTFGPVNCEELQDRTRFYRTDNKIIDLFYLSVTYWLH
jgi:hypothetical protein